VGCKGCSNVSSQASWSALLLPGCIIYVIKRIRTPRNILLPPPRWGVILVLALYLPQHHQTCWILSTYRYLKAFLASFALVSIIFSHILAFSLIWKPRKRVFGTLPPLTRFFSGQNMINPCSTFLYLTCSPVRNIYLIIKIKNHVLFSHAKQLEINVDICFFEQCDMSLEESFAEDV
jgi:hypothetical protein